VKDGFIHIRGFLKIGRLENDHCIITLNGSKVDLDLWWDFEIDRTPEINTINYTGQGTVFTTVPLHRRFTAFFLPVFREKILIDWIIGLVLKPTQRQKGEFFRIGLFKTRRGGQDVLTEPSYDIGEEYFQSDGGDGQYIIRIV